ncbi:Phosphoglycerate kinase [Wickerhamomyces ciferrii]|uniref:Phosphoglycerate kinase n=1 Tax=Wickerhamomyces ciferrii (strain ATCC 14091 / BCRC 22168 / CBS 111 / JCM 3599 / NBRC 0793 / NRRL Y-1031 F-60-10) TaxID=1206466 RepID=K0KTL4_WICCF|nr:Phosphoglycerate kinase [Wickerhamomyces ciferrii]CCH45362.1 Phosphoglycerate kinase [Wickerhamomyces ciferrii]
MSLKNKLSIKDVDLKDKRVLIRVDYNVPHIDKKILDNQRIIATLLTIKYALEQNPKVIILATHLGKPNGKITKELSLDFIAKELSKLLDQEVELLPDCIGPKVEKVINESSKGKIYLLENLRFHIEEEGFRKYGFKEFASTRNVEKFRSDLSKLGDVYINDAFGTCHREHSSIVGINIKERASGLLLSKEIEYFEKTLKSEPARPFLAIVGGGKINDKIDSIDSLLDKVDTLLIGGGMSCTFLKVLKNMNIGHATVEEGIPHFWQVLDIGPKTRELYDSKLSKAQTIIWNGPLGVVKFSSFAKGTKTIVDSVIKYADMGKKVIIGGGDTATMVYETGQADKLDHVATGSGATLCILEGRDLPGVTHLSNKESGDDLVAKIKGLSI